MKSLAYNGGIHICESLYDKDGLPENCEEQCRSCIDDCDSCALDVSFGEKRKLTDPSDQRQQKQPKQPSKVTSNSVAKITPSYSSEQVIGS